MAMGILSQAKGDHDPGKKDSSCSQNRHQIKDRNGRGNHRRVGDPKDRKAYKELEKRDKQKDRIRTDIDP